MKKQTAKTKRSVKASKRPLAPHVRASLLHVAPHKATGKRLAHHHTSHGALLVILVLAGIILFVGIATIRANATSGSNQVHITAQVNGKAPTRGALITSPNTKTQTNSSQLQVTGTCPSGNLVAVYSQGTSVGSTVCQDEGFNLPVQLISGVNVIQAQNYDSLNQAGPTSDQIEVKYVPPVVTPTTPVIPVLTVDPTITAPPAPQPTANPCYQASSDQTPLPGGLSLAVNCVTRSVFVGETISLPITITGGIGPYALTIDWGDESAPDLKSFPSAGNYTVDHTYQAPNIKQLSFRLADTNGASFAMKAVVDVNGTVATAPSTPTTSSVNPSWVEATIPIYSGVAVLIVGFWAGDIFQRYAVARVRARHRRR
jgi:hypothetical protein